MRDEIRCPVCTGDVVELRDGPDGEPDAVIRCQDCGHETRVTYAMQRRLRNKRAA